MYQKLDAMRKIADQAQLVMPLVKNEICHIEYWCVCMQNSGVACVAALQWLFERSPDFSVIQNWAVHPKFEITVQYTPTLGPRIVEPMIYNGSPYDLNRRSDMLDLPLHVLSIIQSFLVNTDPLLSRFFAAHHATVRRRAPPTWS